MTRSNNTLYVLAILILASAVWAYFTPIDISVSNRGMVRPEGGVFHVNAEADGRIIRVHGREGEEVHAGDTLIQFDTSNIDLRQRLLQTRIHAAETYQQQSRSVSGKSAPFLSSLNNAHLELLGLYQELEQVELDRARLTVLSPVDGVIGEINALHPGEVVRKDAAVATIIPSEHRMIVESWLPAKEKRWVYEGQSVRVQPDDVNADRSDTFEGTVVSVSPDVRIIDSAPCYRVVVSPRPDSLRLSSGMTLQVHFIAHRDRLLRVLFFPLQTGFSN